MHTNSKWVRGWERCASALGLVALTVSLGGCAAEMGSPEEEQLGTTEQELVLPQWWQPTFAQSQTVAMAMSTPANGSAQIHVWSTVNAGWEWPPGGALKPLARYCKGSSYINPCSGGASKYRSPFSFEKIKGVAIGKFDGAVYAWYDVNGGRYSKGTASDLSSAQGSASFTPPNDSNNVPLPMSSLIDADQAASGIWHFWWRMPDGTIRLSKSNSPSSGGWLWTGNVKALPLGAVDIAGIFMHGDNTWTFYQKDNVNYYPVDVSTDPMDLIQF